MKDLTNKIAVVTGAASGIGRALSLQLADHGCHLAIADIDKEGLEETVALVKAKGSRCSSHIVDVGSRESVEGFAKDVVAEYGAVHLLINNAGVTLIERVEKIEYHDFEWIMQINFWGVVYGTKAFLPVMGEQSEAHIVNVSSLFGLMALPLQSAYNASKFAVRGFTEALKMELAASTVRVSCVHPGGIKTSITKNSRVGADALENSKEQLHEDFQNKALTTPEKAAAAIMKGVLTNKRRILIGPDAKIGDWIVRHFPATYERVMMIEKQVHARVARREASES